VWFPIPIRRSSSISASPTTKQYFTADDDTPIFPESLLQRGLSFRWKQIKGLPYQADEEKYYELMNNFVSNNKPRRTLNLAGGNGFDIRPGIFVPSGNWPV
jgi:hypothetical protein